MAKYQGINKIDPQEVLELRVVERRQGLNSHLLLQQYRCRVATTTSTTVAVTTWKPFP